ncbi:MAG: hypothetical protein R3B81_15040 [bacterium]
MSTADAGTCEYGLRYDDLAVAAPAFSGDEKAATLIDPSSYECGCGPGFGLTGLHLYFGSFGSGTLSIRAGVHEAVDDGAGCFEPGALLYLSDPWVVSPPSSWGYTYVDVALDAPCLSIETPVFVSVQYELLESSGFYMEVVNRDEVAPLCNDWVDFGAGWVPASNHVPGRLSMWMDVSCCDGPVPVEAATWGTVKALYR